MFLQKWRVAVPLLLACGGARGGVRHSSRLVAYHRVCCVQYEAVELPVGSPDFMKDWTATLAQLDSELCIHSYGFGEFVGEQGVNSSTKEQLPEKSPTDIHWPQARHDKEWAFRGEHIQGQRASLWSGVATCAAIQLIASASEPSKIPIDFFTMDFIHDFTALRPQVIIETGFGEWKHQEMDYSTNETRDYTYKAVYKSDQKLISDMRRSRIITKELLDTELRQWTSSSSERDGIAAFLEYATDSRICRLSEARVIIYEYQMDGLLTIDKLISDVISKALEALRVKMGAGKDDEWLDKIPTKLLTRSPRQKKSFNVSKKKPKTTTSMMMPSARKRLASGSKEDVTIDLSSLESGSLLESLEVQVKSSIFLANAMQRKLKRGMRPTKDHITEILLVNSLLAVSRTKPAQIISPLVQEKLEISRLPIFAVCGSRVAKKVDGVDDVNADGSWLSMKLQVAFDEPRQATYFFGSLLDVPMGEEIDQPSQCLVLSPIGVAHKDFRSLSQQRLDVLFAMTFRREGTWEYDLRLSGDVSHQVDLWDFFGLRGKTLEELFDLVGKGIEQEGYWSHTKQQKRKKKRRFSRKNVSFSRSKAQ